MAEAEVRGQTGAEFRLLGPLQVVRSGSEVSLGGPRQRAVLALLLLRANTVVSVDRLVDEVWDGKPPDGAVRTLQTYVFHLREALEPDRSRGAPAEVLVTRDPGYLLRADRSCIDSAVFEDRVAAGRAALAAGRAAEAAAELGSALSLWRGPVLADLADQEFVQAEASRLDELRLAAVESRIDADLALGRHHAVVGELDRLVAEHPLREELHGQLMLALYRSGRQAEALAAYRRLRDRLADELGIEPSEPLQRLQHAILMQDPTLQAQPAALAEVRAPAEGAGSPPPIKPAPHQRRRLLAAAAVLTVLAAGSLTLATRIGSGGHPTVAANSVGVLDQGKGRFVHEVAVGQSPDGLAFGAGAVWAANTTDGTVSRIDPRSHAVVQTIEVGGAPSAIAVTRDDVWVVNGETTVTRINAKSNTVVQPVKVGNRPSAIAAGASGVWVANRSDDEVVRIDPDTGHVGKPVQVGGGPDGIGVGRDAVWVANGRDGTVSRIDPATGRVSGRVPVGAGPEGIAVTPSAVWVTNALDLTASEVDPVGLRVVATITVGDGPHAIVAAPGAVWVSNVWAGTLIRIDPSTARLTKRIAAGSSPRGLALVGSELWVAAQAFAASSHRGGTLTLVTQGPPDLDPAVAYSNNSTPAQTLVYHGLVGLHRTGGTPGMTLVPDLATRLPLPTEGGRTYTFVLRQGIRYSDGTPVRPGDIRRGVVREFTVRHGGNPGYYAGIIGGQACLADPKRCDLSRGIEVDEKASTVTFHLTQPDPEFLYKLSLNLVAPAPPGAPMTEVTTRPLPGTGPYRISSHKDGRIQALERNPYFSQWSYAAQPDGFPDAIRWQRVADSRQLVAMVLSGKADLLDFTVDTLPAQVINDLGIRYPDQLRSTVATWVTYAMLNTKVAPFDDVRVRRAVNYATDRQAAVERVGGASRATVTCQILLPGFSGYRPYCPYTTGPGPDGRWHGVDLAKARKLVAASGTAGMPVQVWTEPRYHEANKSFVAVLTALGYRATLRPTISSKEFYGRVANSGNRAQITVRGWGPDFPTASAVIAPALTCASFRQNSADNLNLAEYCNRRIDALIKQAQAAQATDPAAAHQLWTTVDHMVTDGAPWVPLYNPTWTTLASDRVGNYQASPVFGPLLGQMWVR